MTEAWQVEQAMCGNCVHSGGWLEVPHNGACPQLLCGLREVIVYDQDPQETCEAWRLDEEALSDDYPY